MPTRLLRQLANEHWRWVIVAWIVLAAALKLTAPSWEQVALDGDLDHLPQNAPSIRASQLLRRAFPNEDAKSQAVIVAARDDRELSVEDRNFVLELSKAIESQTELPLVDVWNAKTPIVHRMLLAGDQRAELVIARLENPLMAFDNIRVRDRVLEVIESMRSQAPAGLEIGVTGSAIIGADMRSAVRESLSATHKTTILLVLACLILIYRAPLLVLVPLATIGLSTSIAFDLVALLAYWFGPDNFEWSGLRVFTTTKIFIVVILFGAGTDYCLFLISRYKEELGGGAPAREAPGLALAHVSSALAGSALTTILGLGAMALARYGKFASGGPVIAVCLLVALVACVTFTPALLRALGTNVFWPTASRVAGGDAQRAAPDRWFWDRLSSAVLRRPGLILAASALVAAPLVVAGWDVPVNHDLLAELPRDSVSIEGAELVRARFGEGWLAPMHVVARQPGANLLDQEKRFDVSLLHNELYQLPEVQDVRSPYLPAGGDPRNRRLLSISGLYDAAAAGSPLSVESFVSTAPGLRGEVIQLGVVLASDPFGQAARDWMPRLREQLERISAAPTLSGQPNPWQGAQFELAGITPGMRDLERITASDQTRIQVCTVVVVLAVLLVILQRPLACLYLILTVLLSYWVTIGATEMFFRQLYGDSYGGLDWKAPIFLFVILVAVGQDYNIYLTTRVLEEQKKHGRREGLRRAIVLTGGIITSCGVIMAGTFVSMTAAALRGMVELGFALALGVLIDTFFVRTVVVPCYFALEARWRGEPREAPAAEQPHPHSAEALRPEAPAAHAQ